MTYNSPCTLFTGNSFGLRRHLAGLHSVSHPSTALFLSLSLCLSSIPHHSRALLTKTTNPNVSCDFVCVCLTYMHEMLQLLHPKYHRDQQLHLAFMSHMAFLGFFPYHFELSVTIVLLLSLDSTCVLCISSSAYLRRS